MPAKTPAATVKSILRRYGYTAQDFTVRSRYFINEGSRAYVFAAGCTDLTAAARCLRSSGLEVETEDKGFIVVVA